MGALHRKWRLRWSLKFAVLQNLHGMMLNIESMGSSQCARLHDRPRLIQLLLKCTMHTCSELRDSSWRLLAGE